MAEETRMVAECLKKGRESYEAGDSEAARKFFLQAQALDPDEPTARLYLERIEKGEAEPAVAETAGKPAAPAGTDESREPAPALAAVPTPPKRPPRRAAGQSQGPRRRRRLPRHDPRRGLFRLQGNQDPGTAAEGRLLGVSPACPGTARKGRGRAGAYRVAPHRGRRSRLGGSPQAARRL